MDSWEGRMEKQGHQKALPPPGSHASCSYALSVTSLPLAAWTYASRENKLLFLKRMGWTQSPHGILETWWVVDSYWILLFEPGAADLYYMNLHS